MRHEPAAAGLSGEFSLNGLTADERTFALRIKRACRIYMSKRFIVRTEKPNDDCRQQEQQKRKKTFLWLRVGRCRPLFILFPGVFFFFFFLVFRAISAARLNMCRVPWAGFRCTCIIITRVDWHCTDKYYVQ